MNTTEFAAFTAPLIGLPVSHVWRGNGSAIFFEFGKLDPRNRRDGSPADPQGEMSLMIEWSWRIEGRRSILCGSWSDEKKWLNAFRLARNATVANASLFGRLPEIDLRLSNDLHVLSFMITGGDPSWVLFDRRGEVTRWLSVLRGVLRVEAAET